MEGGRGSLPSLSLSPALPRKRVGTHALAVTLEGPGSSSPMTSWVPGSLAFIYLFLVIVLGRCDRQGPIRNCHPRATQTL